jgi:hypothetical protein
MKQTEKFEQKPRRWGRDFFVTEKRGRERFGTIMDEESRIKRECIKYKRSRERERWAPEAKGRNTLKAKVIYGPSTFDTESK